MTTMEINDLQQRASRLEGAYEQVDQRLGDLTAAVGRVEAKVNMLIMVTATGGIAIASGMVAIALRV